MRLVTYDVECFAHDWLVVFKDYETKHFTVIYNDNSALRACIDDDSVYCGFNSKGYDQYIIKAICAGFSPEEVKQVNDWIIAGNLQMPKAAIPGCISSGQDGGIYAETDRLLS